MFITLVENINYCSEYPQGQHVAILVVHTGRRDHYKEFTVTLNKVFMWGPC